jgi:hypothetical protein
MREVMVVKRRIVVALVAASLALASFSFGSGSAGGLVSVGLGTAQAAAVTKSASGGSGGGGGVNGAGDRLGDLLSGWAVPVMIVLSGCLLIGALASRNIGASVGIVVITLLGLIFLLSPTSIESFAKGIAGVVF